MNEKIWLSKENNEKYNKGDPAVLQMTVKETNKFPKSIMIAWGISYYGLRDLLILEGTMKMNFLTPRLFYTIKKM